MKIRKTEYRLKKPFIGPDADVFIDMNGGERSIVVNNPKTIQRILNKQARQMIVPISPSPPINDRDLSRLLGKMAVEILAHKFRYDGKWIDEITDKPELDDLKNYVRLGDKPAFWQYHQRRLYNEEDLFFNPKIKKEPYEVLHEFTLLYTQKKEMYLVIAIMGIEYSINLVDDKIDGYLDWLNENNNISPLYDPMERRILGSPHKLWQAGDKLNFVTRK